MKKKTRKRIIQVFAVMLCIIMLLPVVSSFLPPDPATESKLVLMNEFAKAQKAAKEPGGAKANEQLEEIPEDWNGPYEVVGVKTGDMLHIALEDDTFQYIKLLGIEVPEQSNTSNKDDQIAGNESYLHARSLVETGPVYVEYYEKSAEMSEDETLVYLQDGTLMNEKMISDGYATVASPLPDEYIETFVTAEAEAKKQKKGLWKNYWMNK